MDLNRMVELSIVKKQGKAGTHVIPFTELSGIFRHRVKNMQNL